MTSPRSSSGVFKKVCFICEKENRKHKGKRLPLLLSTKELEQSIKNIVLTLNDQNLITKLEVDKKMEQYVILSPKKSCIIPCAE